MTTELEQEFYDTFEIEPKWKDKRVKYAKTYYTEEQAQYLRETTKNRNIQLCYPDITSEKLLEMICIYAQREVFCFPVVPANEETWTISSIKENIIEQLMYLGKYSDDRETVKEQIQQLFKD